MSGKSQREWSKATETLKYAMYVVFGLAFSMGAAYLIAYTVALDGRSRSIWGISLQLSAGLVFALERLMQKVKVAEMPESVKKLFGQPEKSLSLVIMLLMPFGLFLAVCLTDIKAVNWEVVGGILIFLMFAYTVYLWLFERLNLWIKKLVEWKVGANLEYFKYAPYSNLGIFVVALAMGVGLITFLRHFSTDIKYLNAAVSVVVVMIGGFVVLPLYLLAGSYTIIYWPYKLLTLMKRLVPKAVFWVLIFVLWTWGSGLLLTNVVSN